MALNMVPTPPTMRVPLIPSPKASRRSKRLESGIGGGECVVVSGEVGGSGVVLASGALPGVGFERERRAAVMSGGGRTRVGLGVCYQGCVNVINEDAICRIP